MPVQKIAVQLRRQTMKVVKKYNPCKGLLLNYGLPREAGVKFCGGAVKNGISAVKSSGWWSMLANVCTQRTSRMRVSGAFVKQGLIRAASYYGEANQE